MPTGSPLPRAYPRVEAPPRTPSVPAATQRFIGSPVRNYSLGVEEFKISARLYELGFFLHSACRSLSFYRLSIVNHSQPPKLLNSKTVTKRGQFLTFKPDPFLLPTGNI